jgi:pimeloyl-ACP methyl ester carboxylesterase
LSEDLNKAIPNSLMKIISNCGHFYSYEQPELVSHTVLNYLEAFGPAAAAARGGR